VAERKKRQPKRSVVQSPALPAVRLNPVWGSRKMAVLDGRQVRCMTFDEGSVWIHGLDRLPPLVRQRLADARHNICPTCVDIEAHHNGGRYFAVIEAIERVLDQAEQRFNADSI